VRTNGVRPRRLFNSRCCSAQRVARAPNDLLPWAASTVKLKATELAKWASLDGMQKLGGYGYATETRRYGCQMSH
jgi:alkylation response protein AidB-like acyl-CoA dehydrogenase